jgi:hypothetical protein
MIAASMPTVLEWPAREEEREGGQTISFMTVGAQPQCFCPPWFSGTPVCGEFTFL